MKAIGKTNVLVVGFIVWGSPLPAMASSVHTGDAEVSPILPAGLLEMQISEFIKLSARDFNTVTAKKLNV